MIDDFIDEQAKKINEEINYVKQQWKIVVDDLNSLKEKLEYHLFSTEKTKHQNFIFLKVFLT